MRKPKHSTSRSPFDAHREVGLRLTVDEYVLDGTPWTSAPCTAFFVVWEDVWKSQGHYVLPLASQLAVAYAASDLPLVTVMVSLSLNNFEFLQQLEAAPTVEEIADRLAVLRVEVERLGSLFQGGNGRDSINPNPVWLQPDSGNEDRNHADSFIQTVERRRASLHPILKNWIDLAFTNQSDQDADDFGKKEIELVQAARQSKLIEFCDGLPELIDTLSKAEELCRRDGSIMHKQGRTLGAPGDIAKDWLYVRLMWIWRDVLGQDVTIYAKRIQDRAELAVPEPQGCMAFIVGVMRDVDPIKPTEILALERKLGLLAHLVPKNRLAIPNSRGN